MDRKHFFISYNSADRTWAEWIAWQLEDAGYTTVLQAWDFRPGSNFVLEMQQAVMEAERTIAVLSPDHLTALYTQSEWAAAFVQDPTGEKGTFLPICVRKCDLEGLLGPIIYIDLVEMEEADAKKALLDGVRRERSKPKFAPAFPHEAERSVTARPGFPGALPPIWNVPHHRNPNFTGREKLINDLRNTLKSKKPGSFAQAINGLGGIGKTQVAIEYAHRYAAKYDTVWWIRAEEPKTLKDDYIRLAEALRLSWQDETEKSDITTTLKSWLGQNTDWLLIFDSAKSKKDILPFLPQGETGHVIITSRNQNWLGVTGSLPIDVLERTESVAFLCKRTWQKDEETADSLSEALGDLPLALEQAGAYMEATGRSLKDYSDLFVKRRRALLKRAAPSTAYPYTVETTWELSFKQIGKLSPVAVELLNLFAFLAPDEIPRDILFEEKDKTLRDFSFVEVDNLPESLEHSFADPIELDDVLVVLGSYSMIKIKRNRLYVHRLVQAVTRDRLQEDEKKKWAKIAIQIMNNVFPYHSYDISLWPRSVVLVPHLLAAIEHARELRVAENFVHDLESKLTFYFMARSVFSNVEPHIRRALDLPEERLRKGHPDVALAFRNLAISLQDIGKYIEAEQLFEKALIIQEAQLGSEHLDLAATLSSQAIMFYDQHRYAEAEPLFRRALLIIEKQDEIKQANVAALLNNLAGSLFDQGKYAEAEPYCRQLLKIQEEQLGKNYPEIAATLSNLAALLYMQNDYDEAELYYRKALEIREAQQEKDYIEIAASLQNIAGVLHAQEKYDEAELVYRRALKIREIHQGKNDPDVAVVTSDFASVLYNLGKPDEAELMYHRALEISETEFAKDHPRLADNFGYLAQVLQSMEKDSEAEQLLYRELEIREAQKGKDHPDLLVTLNRLTKLFYSQGKYAEAEPLSHRILAISEEQLAKDHPSVLEILNKLTGGLQEQARDSETKSVYRKVLEIAETEFATNYPIIAANLNYIAELHYNQKKYSEATQLYLKALRLLEVQQGEYHPYVIIILKNLVAIYVNQENYTDAEPLYRRILEISEALPAKDHLTIAQNLNNLAFIIHNQGKYNEARLIYKRALSIIEKEQGKEHSETQLIRNNLRKLQADMRKQQKIRFRE
jgi:tetratricopeptide (TPR) repeat protein